MFQVFFRDECIVVQTVLLSGGRLMSFTLAVVVIGRLLRTMFGVPWLILLHRWVHMVVVAFRVDWVLIFLALLLLFLPGRDLERCLRHLFGCFSRELSFAAFSRSSSSFSLGVSTMYISCDEVAVQRPVGGGSCSSPASSCIPSMSSESKSRMSVRSSTVAIKWVVGGE